MSYNYNTGDGLSALDAAEPDGSIEPVSILDQAIRQIKAYLKDTEKGPQALLDALNSNETGVVKMFAGATPPDGYLICDGSAVDRVTYAALYAVIGVAYGTGDGSSTFNLPDFRGRVPVGCGLGDATGGTSWTRGRKDGEEKHVLLINETPKHSHQVNAASNNGAGGAQAGSNSAIRQETTITTTEVGNDEAHNNLQPSLGINFIIKI